MRIGKALKIFAVSIALVVIVVVAAFVGLLMFGGAPMTNGSALADGKITLVVDRMGPVRIGIYIVDLAEGGFALIDSGEDVKAAAVLSALERRGGHADDVRAVFLTHAHSDHAGGVGAFPQARVFALAADASNLSGLSIQALADGERTTIAGTTFETFAVPGHTAGSAAYLVEGVLFMGDAAASVSDSAIAPNDFAFTADKDQLHRSLRALATRLAPRRDEIHSLAFGHQGPVKGLDPLIDWASKK